VIKESFKVCGIMKHDRSPTGDWLIQLSVLHLVLKVLIKSNGQIVAYVEEDLELEEAEQLMMQTREDEAGVANGAHDDGMTDEDDDDELNEIEQMELDLQVPSNNNRWVIPTMQNISLGAHRSASAPEQLESVLEQVCIVQNVGYTPVYTTLLPVS